MRKNSQKPINQISSRWNILFHILLSAVSIITVAPVILMVIISFSSSDSIEKVGYTFWPAEWSLQGYKYLLEMGDQIWNSYLVTIVSTVVYTVLALAAMLMLAYVICQKSFWLHRGLTWYVFFTMLFSGGLIPTYIVITRYFHMKDTFWVLVIPGLVSANWVIILRSFIRTMIPEALFESARIDGAGHFTIFFRIALPLSKAGIGTIGLFAFIAKWNDWYQGRIYIQNPKLIPLQTLLTRMQDNLDYLKNNASILSRPEGWAMLKNLPSTNLRMACTVVAVLPVLCAYPFFQRYFVTGLTMGSIKE